MGWKLPVLWTGMRKKENMRGGDVDCLLSSYNFDLPEERIAQYPGERGASRLLVVKRHPVRVDTDGCSHVMFADLPRHLPGGALLVANNSRVVPARLLGRRAGGGRAEFLLLTPLPLIAASAVSGSERCFSAEVEGLIRPGKRIRCGDRLVFDACSVQEAHSREVRVSVLERRDFGRCRARIEWTGEREERPVEALRACLEVLGHLPLPPYIRRPDTPEDALRYQTVYAREDRSGSVAAPTAGLHFTPQMRECLRERGFGWAEVTLHVGYGTFSPVRCADVRDHVMHPEYVEIPPATAEAVSRARSEGRPVLAVGTTSARALEGAAAMTGSVEPALVPFSGQVNIFIRPGYRFRLVDGLLTNFHLPESTLLMLVAALTGRERILDIYAEAVRRKYRFFSYGDAMLIC